MDTLLGAVICMSSDNLHQSFKCSLGHYTRTNWQQLEQPGRITTA